MSDSLPPIDSALLPPAVRKAGPQAEKTYQVALAFEGLLERQLAQAMTSTVTGADGSGDGSSGADPITSLYAQMLPDALARGLTSAGGLGLAGELYRALGGATGAAGPARPTGGGVAPSGGRAAGGPR